MKWMELLMFPHQPFFPLPPAFHSFPRTFSKVTLLAGSDDFQVTKFTRFRKKKKLTGFQILESTRIIWKSFKNIWMGLTPRSPNLVCVLPKSIFQKVLSKLPSLTLAVVQQPN
jgi:hypothetical protein